MQVLIIRKDADGFELEPVGLGKSFIAALDEITEKSLYELKQTLKPLMNPPRYAREEELTELRDKLQARLAVIKGERLDDANDPEFVAWNHAARDVMKIARRESEL
jgi:hypothetical protein